ncbi:MAG: aminopeptidase P family protein [Nitriliruptor sp.]|nr:MAG: aminopeptidase P family protein [Nitriliruptor sp.]
MDNARLAAAAGAARDAGLDALLVGPSADLRYLIGYDAHAMERLTLLVLTADGHAHLVLPELEAPAARASGAAELVELVPWTETEDPIAVVQRLLRRPGPPGAVAVSDRLHSVFTLRLQAALPGTAFRPSGPVLGRLRIIKSPAEQQALRAAGTAIDAVHAAVPELLRPGRTEAEVGRELSELILAEHDEVAFVIVGSGPNGASPHHAVSDRVLEPGDAVVVDIGGVRDGYCSDMTRNYAVGTLPAGYAELHAVLAVAQDAAVQAVAPGAIPAEIDRAARDVIAEAGHGERFIHRTGHGIGIEVHEDPYIVATNTTPVAAGMAFSIEPGIYLPGRFGMRIEDIVLVTDTGVERINHRPREVLVAG